MNFKLPMVHQLIVLIIANVSLINVCTTSFRDPRSQVCETEGCIEAARYLLSNMNKTVDPCENFYNFACGKFITETVIPKDKSSVTLFSQVTDALKQKLKLSIEQEIQKDDPATFKLLQSYYNICLDTDKRSIREIKNILIKLGNWPVLIGGAWNEPNFDWKKIIYRLRQMGYTSSISSIVKFDIQIDEKNTTRYVITLDQAKTGIKQEYLSKGIKENVVQAYFEYMVELAQILGADHKQAEKELADSLSFEIELAKISLANVERRSNLQSLYNLKTVKQLQSEYPDIPWKEYLNKLSLPQSHIEPFDKVIVKVPSFLKSLPRLISKTPKRVLANYICWRVVHESALYLNNKVKIAAAKFKASLTGTNVQRPQWEQCIIEVSAYLPVATGAFYVRKNFDRKTKSVAQVLVRDLRESFENILKTIDWMDEETRKAALMKLDAIQTYVGYSNEFFENEKLDKHFGTLKVNTNSFLISHLQLNLFNLEHSLKRLRKRVKKKDWIAHGNVAIVNAYYSAVINLIHIPAGILQGNFFTSTRPSYMNYGFTGWIIGHEFTHGFDDQGSRYDRDGNLANWWNIETKKEYLKRAQCIIDQYSNYTSEQVGLNLNGKITQGENIADNGGLKEAYFAYENFAKRNGKEPRLPGLSYSPKQLFWISAANLWCGKYRPEDLKNRILTDVHSPGEFRVVGTFSNLPQFARDFKCPVGSSMNPVKKCTVW